jgi:hypothetical protein
MFAVFGSVYRIQNPDSSAILPVTFSLYILRNPSSTQGALSILSVLKTGKHNVSESGCVSSLR